MPVPHFLSSLLEDDAPKPKVVAAPTPQPQVPVPVPVMQTMTGDMGAGTVVVADPNDSAYQGLLAKTDINSHPVFQTINKHLAPIAALALDEKTKFTIAFKQAQTLDGLQVNAVLDVFAQAKTTLQGESDKFAQTITKAIADKVDGPKAKAADLSSQIQQLQDQVKQLTEDSFNAQQKIQAAQHRFDVALSTRQSEISQIQAKYASLLGEQ